MLRWCLKWAIRWCCCTKTVEQPDPVHIESIFNWMCFAPKWELITFARCFITQNTLLHTLTCNHTCGHWASGVCVRECAIIIIYIFCISHSRLLVWCTLYVDLVWPSPDRVSRASAAEMKDLSKIALQTSCNKPKKSIRSRDRMRSHNIQIYHTLRHTKPHISV